MTTLPIRTLAGDYGILTEKEHNLEVKQFVLDQMQFYKGLLRRNPAHSEAVMTILEEYYKIYKKLG